MIRMFLSICYGLLLSLQILAFPTLSSGRFNRLENNKIRPKQRHVLHMSNIEYRNAQEKDLEAIGILCAEAFEGPFQWYQMFEKAKTYEKSILAIKQRWYNFIIKKSLATSTSTEANTFKQNKVKHAMIVAVDKDKKGTDVIIGFVELGQLPSPIQNTLISNSTISSNTVISDISIDDDNDDKNILMATVNNLTNDNQVIHEGNDNTSSFQSSTSSISSSINNNNSNNSDINSYDNDDAHNSDNNNTSDSDETEIINSVLNVKATAVAVSQDNANTNKYFIEEAEFSSNNDVTYLGNVAIALEYRRQSIATKLIKISYKILERWEDDYLYAAVDSTNTAALRLYIDKLGFEVVLDEKDLISRRRTSPLRIYLRKSLTQPVTLNQAQSSAAAGVETDVLENSRNGNNNDNNNNNSSSSSSSNGNNNSSSSDNNNSSGGNS